MIKKEYKMFQQKQTLHRLVDNIISLITPETAAGNSRLINEVNPLLILKSDPGVVRSVIKDLIKSLLENCRKRNIRISAKEIGNILLVHVKDYNNVNSATSDMLPFSIIDRAKSISGYVGITRHFDNTTVVAFSFPNLPMAA
jgi:hypothetical protein